MTVQTSTGVLSGPIGCHVYWPGWPSPVVQAAPTTRPSSCSLLRKAGLDVNLFQRVLPAPLDVEDVADANPGDRVNLAAVAGRDHGNRVLGRAIDDVQEVERRLPDRTRERRVNPGRAARARRVIHREIDPAVGRVDVLADRECGLP